jgi:hypothetical protein
MMNARLLLATVLFVGLLFSGGVDNAATPEKKTDDPFYRLNGRSFSKASTVAGEASKTRGFALYSDSAGTPRVLRLDLDVKSLTAAPNNDTKSAPEYVINGKHFPIDKDWTVIVVDSTNLPAELKLPRDSFAPFLDKVQQGQYSEKDVVDLLEHVIAPELKKRSAHTSQGQ